MSTFTIKFFDVEQGSCAFLISPNGQTVLFDCGHNSKTGFHPSNYLIRNYGIDGRQRRLTKLVLSYPDQDHISDILKISQLQPIILVRNPDISSSQIRIQKLQACGFVEPEVEEYIRLHEIFTAPAPEIDWGGIEFAYFYNSPAQFEDLNDLSVVAFVHYQDFGLILPGDLSKKGWDWLLYKHPQSALFCENLKNVKIFVASHHGRTDGYSEDVFNYCSPEIIIFSDKGVEYDTQRSQQLYAKHTRGIPFTYMFGKTLLFL